MSRQPPTPRSSVEIPSEARPKFLTPFRLLVIVASIIFFGEVVVMILLGALPEMATIPEALFDGFLITSIVTPVLILFLIRPMVMHIDRREMAEERLRNLNHTLEDCVSERTAELTAANEQLKREIADRKMAENVLSKNADFIESVLRSAPCILAIYDVNTLRCSFVSDCVGDLLGITPDAVVVKGPSLFDELFSTADLARFRELNARIAAGIERGGTFFECPVRPVAGDPVSFSFAAAPLPEKNSGSSHDVLLAAVPTRSGWPTASDEI